MKGLKVSYRILLGVIKSKAKNEWYIYRNNSDRFDVVRKKDGLTVYFPGEASLYDFNKNKKAIEKVIETKEKTNK